MPISTSGLTRRSLLHATSTLAAAAVVHRVAGTLAEAGSTGSPDAPPVQGAEQESRRVDLT